MSSTNAEMAVGRRPRWRGSRPRPHHAAKAAHGGVIAGDDTREATDMGADDGHVTDGGAQ